MPKTAIAQLGAEPSDIVIDAGSGAVLQADNPDERRFPASLTKMMTLYMTFDALRHHRISLRRIVPVSRHAASMEPTKLWLKPGTRITVEQCILGMVTLSANDAAVAIGELLGGSERRFARLMTQRARMLGMRHTLFRNASGLPDPAQITTARDMAILARALIAGFPEFYPYFSTTHFVFRGRAVYGHDPMLGAYEGADGLKTGFTSAAGYNMATSAVRGRTRLVGIVLGAQSIPVRSAMMTTLLDEGFGRYALPAEVANIGQHVQIPHLIQTAVAAEVPPESAIPSSIHDLGNLQPEHRRLPPKGYSVQVGSFRSHATALRAVRLAVATAGGVAQLRPIVSHGRRLWRSRVISLTRAGARRLCPQPARKAGRCSIMRNGRSH